MCFCCAQTFFLFIFIQSHTEPFLCFSAMDLLPTELLDTVFAFTPDTSIIRLVNTRWRNIFDAIHTPYSRHVDVAKKHACPRVLRRRVKALVMLRTQCVEGALVVSGDPHEPHAWWSVEHLVKSWDIRVTNIHAVVDLSSLQVLNLWNTRISDVTALKHCRGLKRLNLGNTLVTDIWASGRSHHTSKTMFVKHIDHGLEASTKVPCLARVGFVENTPRQPRRLGLCSCSSSVGFETDVGSFAFSCFELQET